MANFYAGRKIVCKVAGYCDAYKHDAALLMYHCTKAGLFYQCPYYEEVVNKIANLGRENERK